GDQPLAARAYAQILGSPRAAFAILCIPPATRTRSHMPRIFRVPPRAVRPIAVHTGSAMVAVATHALKRRSGPELTDGSDARIWRSRRLAGSDRHPDEQN